VLAYSTVSQLGYMFLAAGVGAFGASTFHLITHAFFKALLFLGSGAVIHAMAGEQDMQRMGGLRRYLPVTFVTMMIGALAIAGIPPLAGFFSKDEILMQAFAKNRALWALGSVTALLTAFYMFRLIALTFYGAYRGPAWPRPVPPPVGGPATVVVAAVHGVRHPADPAAHGLADVPQHDVSHGPAHPVPLGPGAHTHEWHGPHEAPNAMTWPLMALAVGAIVCGFISIPPVLGGTGALERFLEPSFVAAGEGSAGHGGASEIAAHTAGTPAAHPSSREWGLMLMAVTIAGAGIAGAWRLYVQRPELPARLAARWPGLHSLLWHKYYVDEFYGATFIRSTFASARALWTFDARVVDGAVNGSGWVTRTASWFSGLFDRVVVDGLVNLVGWSADEGSLVVRRSQSGLLQNYALLIVLGVCIFLTVYLFAR
jgi:NADH-quinone oxidoreductase subunit L